MDIDARSQILTGRYEALRLWAAIGRFAKPEFTTGQVVALTGASSTQCSKELSRLKHLGLLTAVSRRGDYARTESPFWALVDALVSEWETSPAPKG